MGELSFQIIITMISDIVISPYDSYWYNNGYLFPDMGTAFIAIDKCDQENGCLKVCSPPQLHVPRFSIVLFQLLASVFCCIVLKGAERVPSSGQDRP